jgi:hypothetical protein
MESPRLPVPVSKFTPVPVALETIVNDPQSTIPCGPTCMHHTQKKRPLLVRKLWGCVTLSACDVYDWWCNHTSPFGARVKGAREGTNAGASTINTSARAHACCFTCSNGAPGALCVRGKNDVVPLQQPSPPPLPPTLLRKMSVPLAGSGSPGRDPKKSIVTNS